MRKIARRNALCSLTAVCAGALVLLGGCRSEYVSPTADTLSGASWEIENDVAIRTDTHLRMLLEDLGTATYNDRPSRLNRRPIPY